MFRFLFSLGPLVFLLASATAEISLAPLFQTGAVLQQGKPVPVWGMADPGTRVTVSFAGQEVDGLADPAGRWMLTLEPMETSPEGRSLAATAEGSPTIRCDDVLVGEVWLASGQSNMQWPVARSRAEDQQKAADGPVPLLRLFQVPRGLSHIRRDTVDAKWTPATPESARDFSAVGYFFGRKLAEELEAPVGIIHGSWGGSRIEPWWAEEGLVGIEDLAETRTARLLRSPGFPEYDKSYLAYVGKLRSWTDAAEAAVRAGRTVPDQPKPPALLALGHNRETGTYQAMIHPLVPYALRGFIWYQGESNLADGMAYAAKMRALINGWRKQFRAPEAPFLFAQLAPYRYGRHPADFLPVMWEAQRSILAMPHTGMACTIDIGNPGDIHPRNKSEVGRRLSLWALADTYGRSELVKSGPLIRSVTPQDGGLVIRFDHTGGGLTTRDGKAPGHFEIAGSDGGFHPAVAGIGANDKSVVLTSPEVPEPTRARFAWSDTARPNLMNKEGLPAAAFHTRVHPPGGAK